jgi:hypothetical protein
LIPRTTALSCPGCLNHRKARHMLVFRHCRHFPSLCT